MIYLKNTLLLFVFASLTMTACKNGQNSKNATPDNSETYTGTASVSQGPATVLTENKMGYGYACLCGMDYVAKQSETPDIIVFIDGDYSDYPEDLTKVV